MLMMDTGTDPYASFLLHILGMGMGIGGGAKAKGKGAKKGPPKAVSTAKLYCKVCMCVRDR